MENILQQLNQSQRAAVTYNDGPQLVIAGAGSGKTRVLTYKIAYLLTHPELGLHPWNILALTFTNKAAREMKQRVSQLMGYGLQSGLAMGTFHSIFARILRREADIIGYTPNFTIYDETDSQSLISAIVKEQGLDTTYYKPSGVHARISMAKNRLISSAAYSADRGLRNADEAFNTPDLHRVYALYEQRCKAANAMDFDDLLVNTYRLLKDHEDARTRYERRFAYILVDEYQDTNYVQQCIISLLTSVNHRVCVVGDDAQSIYAFRGADIDNILGFSGLYPETKVFKLEQNYRSTQNIVNTANSLISHNQRQIHKDVYSKNDVGDPVQLYAACSDKLEAIRVCDVIRAVGKTEPAGYEAFAVLYRTNVQSRVLEEEMRRRGIPYRIYGGLSFYQRKEIKNIIAYFRVVVNPDDDEAIRRIINYPARGIGSTTLSRISDCAATNGCSFGAVVSAPEHYGLNVNRGTVGKLQKFAAMIDSFRDALRTEDAASLGKRIIRESGVHDDIFSSKEVDSLSRQENVEELINELCLFVAERKEEGNEDVGLDTFIQDVSLLTDKDHNDDTGNCVTLMTIHASKGLEFPNVFVVGLEDGILPSSRSLDNMRMLEEERRLLYVAITRAERRCYLSYARTRFRYGHVDEEMPSRFIEDLDMQYIEEVNDMGMAGFSARQSSRQVQREVRMESPRAAAWTASRMKPMPRAAASEPQTASTVSREFGLAVGMEIEHQRFGRGRVMAIEGNGENTKATIEFQSVGRKQLLLKFARYKVVG